MNNVYRSNLYNINRLYILNNLDKINTNVEGFKIKNKKEFSIYSEGADSCGITVDVPSDMNNNAKALA